AAQAAVAGGAITPTPIKSTRSFNPLSTDPNHSRAKIYYSATAGAATLEAKVYNVAGTLIRTLSPSDLTLADFGNFYFTWDGANDGGTVVRNGIYLVRFETKLTDGTSRTETKMVALIK